MQVMISCGEASGSLYAAALADRLRTLDADVRIFGLGGRELALAGVELVGDYHGLSVTGLSEALAVLPRSWQMLRRLVAAARERRPDVFVAVDFPDFNFRLAAAIRRLGIPVVYYISPQLWAWRSGRLRTMARLADLVLVIFPFEEAIYRDADIPVEFVGHPLVELTQVEDSAGPPRARLGLDPDRRTVALLPGSRPNELRAMASDLAAAAREIARRAEDVQLVVACAPGLSPELFEPFRTGAWPERARPRMVEARTDDVLAASDLVLTASGTATVQCAIHGRPMVIVYRLSPITYRLGKPFVRVDTYGMVNLIAGRPVVPELIQDELTPDAVVREAMDLLSNPARADRTRDELARVRRMLGGPGASLRAAEAILRTARERRANGAYPLE